MPKRSYLVSPIPLIVNKSIFPEEIPFVNLEEDLAVNASQYISLYLKLLDDESRNVLSTLVEYRFTGETALVQEIYDSKKPIISAIKSLIFQTQKYLLMLEDLMGVLLLIFLVKSVKDTTKFTILSRIHAL